MRVEWNHREKVRSGHVPKRVEARDKLTQNTEGQNEGKWSK